MMSLNKIKNAVNSIEMSKTMKNRIKENCYSIEQEKSVQLNSKRWISVACAFGILFSIVIGIPFVNKSGDVRVANFAITAYAMNDDGSKINTNLSSKKATFDLSTRERLGLVIASGGDVDNYIYTNVRLNITGEDIESITYTINKGEFIKDVLVTEEQAKDDDWLVSENINSMGKEPDSHIWQGIKEIGNSYTVAYNEQDKYGYALAISHDGNNVIDDDVVIKVNVKYKDGSSKQQDIVATQEGYSISLKLK
ncbi:hypothetical protein ACIQXF_21125 [Lysinibacillus sp. NPDC097231]|uniref:hypothetical protein n=1 Tax=Lysinibacillus sp. NPDC097231 TaxID=3364142 RepID=UPI0037F32912